MTRNNLDGDHLFCEPLDFPDIEVLGVIDERNRQAVTSGAPCPANPMHIVLGKFWQVVIKDVGYRRHIDAACGNIRSDENPYLSPA